MSMMGNFTLTNPKERKLVSYKLALTMVLLRLSLLEYDKDINDPSSSSQVVPQPDQHRIDVVPKDFSFDKRATT